MKSICLFSSYFQGEALPYYVRFYLENLCPHFTQIVFLNNRKELNKESKAFLQNKSITTMMVDNEGYDFGMWYKAFKAIDTSAYERVALVNDSCILFKSLDEDFAKINASMADCIGMVISDRYSTHLQSFFLVYNQSLIQTVRDYFFEKGIINDYRTVIQTYEIGLCKFLLEKGYTVESLYNNSERAFAKNPSFALVTKLIGEGIPLIKKKIIYRNYRGLEYYWIVRMNFETDYRKHILQIENKYKGHNMIDFKSVMAEAPRKNNLDVVLFSIARKTANTLRLVPGMRWIFNQSIALFKKILNR
jgi:lipopolysaccharide biosynthesis protein